MAKYKMYEMIIDDGDNVYKVTRAAKGLNDLKARYGGNGEFVRIKDVTNSVSISCNRLHAALNAAGFSESERESIVSIIDENYANMEE